MDNTRSSYIDRIRLILKQFLLRNILMKMTSPDIQQLLASKKATRFRSHRWQLLAIQSVGKIIKMVQDMNTRARLANTGTFQTAIQIKGGRRLTGHYLMGILRW